MLIYNLFKLLNNLSVKLKILITELHFVSGPVLPIPKREMVVALIYVFHGSAILLFEQ